MIKMKESLIAYLVFIISLSFLGCVQTETSVMKEAKVEVWLLELSGQTRGKLEMTLQRAETKEDIYSVKGKITGKIEDHLGGAGRASYTIKGSIDNGVLKARLGGSSDMDAGSSFINGTIQGNLSDSKGAGTWKMTHELGPSSGTYTMER